MAAFFLAGSLSGGQIAGDVYEYELATDAGDKLTLLMQEPLDPSVEGSHHPIGIVGTISRQPGQRNLGLYGHRQACDLGHTGDSARLSDNRQT